MKHDGVAIAVHSHCGISSFPVSGFLFLDKMNHTPREEKLLKPSRVRKEGRENFAFPFAPDQKPIRPVKKMGPESLREKVH
jgi:hypothetical protein